MEQSWVINPFFIIQTFLGTIGKTHIIRASVAPQSPVNDSPKLTFLANCSLSYGCQWFFFTPPPKVKQSLLISYTLALIKALNWKLAWHLEKLIESSRPKIVTKSKLFGVFLTWNGNFLLHQPFYCSIVLLSVIVEILFNLHFSQIPELYLTLLQALLSYPSGELNVIIFI